MKPAWLFAAVGLALAPALPAATFNVTSAAEFQSALTTAQSNGENDTINVAAGTYNIAASGTLTYVAAATENASLNVFGVDSDLVILDGGMQVPILRIDTTAVTADELVTVEITNMTFRNGNATGAFEDGGAIAIEFDDSQQPAEFATLVGIRGSEFYDNRADDDGGAIYFRGHAVEGVYLDDLTIDGNQATANGGGAYLEGGLFTTPILINNIDFFDNVAGIDGGGLLARGFDADTPGEDRARSVAITVVEFFNNSSTSTSGGGGGADIASLDTFLELVAFVDNDANEGGGLRLREDWTLFRMINSGFIGNTSFEDGGGLQLREARDASATITNNTIVGNSATGNFGRGGGMAIEVDGSSGLISIYNNIIHGNTTPQSDADDLYVDHSVFSDIASTVDLFNNDFTEALITPGPFNAGGNIDADPLLADVASRPLPDVRLTASSPAIDSGLNTAPLVPNRDFEGDARPQDGDNDGTATVDMGADEFTGAVTQNADLSLTKTDAADPVTEGGNITYTLVVANAGPGPASSVSLVDTLPAQVSFVSAAATQGSCAAAAGTVTCSLGSIASGADATATIVVATPDVPEPLVLTNQATVSGAEPDPVTTNNNASEETTVVPAAPTVADVALTKSAAPSPVFSGGPRLTYTLDVTNNGPAGASSVVVTDTLPAGVTFDSAMASVGTCTPSATAVSCALGDLAVNAGATVTIVVVPDIVVSPVTLTNTATVSAEEDDPTPGNNTATTQTVVNPPAADVSVVVTPTPAEPLVNEQISYAIRIANAGPSDDTGAVLTVSLPAMAAFVSATIEQGVCAEDAGTVTCTIGDLPFGAAVNATIVVSAPSTAMTLTLAASVAADVTDPVTDNNAAENSLAVIDVIDIVVQGKSNGGGSVGNFELIWLLLIAGMAGTAPRLSRVSRKVVRSLAIVIVVSATSTAVLLGAAAHADDTWYVGAAYGWVSLDYDEGDLAGDLLARGWSVTDPDVDDSDAAYKLYVGYQFNDWLALEGGYVDLGEVVTQFGASIPPNEVDALLTDTLSVHPYLGDGYFVAGVMRWPVVADGFAVVARVGVLAWESDTTVRVIRGASGRVGDDESGTDIMFGAGVEFAVSERWALTADWERYKLNEWLDVPSIGFLYRF